jgi:hypothetical protein
VESTRRYSNDTPETLDEVHPEESQLDRRAEQSWADGFVTSDGTRVPLFIPFVTPESGKTDAEDEDQAAR